MFQFANPWASEFRVDDDVGDGDGVDVEALVDGDFEVDEDVHDVVDVGDVDYADGDVVVDVEGILDEAGGHEFGCADHDDVSTELLMLRMLRIWMMRLLMTMLLLMLVMMMVMVRMQKM